jgi:hypothetical protein
MSNGGLFKLTHLAYFTLYHVLCTTNLKKNIYIYIYLYIRPVI